MNPDSTRLLILTPPTNHHHRFRHQHGHSHPNKPACSASAPPHTHTRSFYVLALQHLGMGWHEKTQTQNPTRPWDQQLLLDLPHKQREWWWWGEPPLHHPPPNKKYHPKTCSLVSKCTLMSKLAPSSLLSSPFFVTPL